MLVPVLGGVRPAVHGERLFFCLETQVRHGEDLPPLTDVQCLPTAVRMQEDPPGGPGPAHGHPAGHAAGHPVCLRHRQGRQAAGHHHHQREQQLNGRAGPFVFFPSAVSTLDMGLLRFLQTQTFNESLKLFKKKTQYYFCMFSNKFSTINLTHLPYFVPVCQFTF